MNGRNTVHGHLDEATKQLGKKATTGLFYSVMQCFYYNDIIP